MVITFLVLLIFSIILFLSSSHNEATKWAAFFLFIASLGVFGGVIEHNLIPALNEYGISTDLIILSLTKIRILVRIIAQTFFPYILLMFGIVYSEKVSTRIKRLLAVLLLSPVIFTFFITPLSLEHKIELNYKILLMWVSMYILALCTLLVYLYFSETNQLKKKNRFQTMIIIVPTALAVLFLYYGAKAFYPGMPLYRYSFPLVVFSFLMFIIFSLKNGVLGVKLRLERQIFNNTIRAITTSSAMLNHAIKNRISHINLLAERIKDNANASANPEISRDIKSLFEETNHILGMIKRIQKNIEDIDIKESPENLVSIVQGSINMNVNDLSNKTIQLYTNFPCHVELMCDKVHLQEVLNNIINNAIEAINNEKGRLNISLYKNKKHIVIEIEDNGIGILREDLSKLFDPFFSTKKREQNFGLGLSYCYLVMQKHGGNIEVQSVEGKGTKFFIKLPMKKVLLLNKNILSKKGMIYESN